ncbi:hypothetical protein ACFWY6_44450 [Streptomyces sp. NPDC059037]|uniref:hypothetical protein n=1 Tax=Streptomyces sp. NPDC059037 TaxID=3346710 RepID=UPI0036BEB11A
MSQPRAPSGRSRRTAGPPSPTGETHAHPRHRGFDGTCQAVDATTSTSDFVDVQ